MNTTIHISRFKEGAKATVPMELHPSWSQLYKALTTARVSGNGKLTVPGISYAEYGPVKKRANENVKLLHALSYDIDNKNVPVHLRPEDIDVPHAHAHHSTYSSTPDHPMWRLVLPLTHGVDPETYKVLYRQTAKDLGIEQWCDFSCIDPARMFFEFRAPSLEHVFSGGNPDAPFLEPPAAVDVPEIPAAADADAFEAFAANAGQEGDLHKIESCLTVLDPDCDRQSWLRAGMSIHHETEGSDAGFTLWHGWSEQGTKYAGQQDCTDRWESFGASKANPTTMASLVHQAKVADPQWRYTPPAVEDYEPGLYRFTQPNESLFFNDNLPKPDWCVDNLFCRNTPVMFTGVGNVGKSTYVSQLAIALAQGMPFQGHHIATPHQVIYMSREDSTMKFYRRIQAYRALHPGEDLQRAAKNLSYYGSERPFAQLTMGNTRKAKVVKQLIASIRRLKTDLPQIIVFDPLVSFAGGEENSNTEMAFFINVLQAIISETDTTTLTVHHEGKGKDPSGNYYAGRGASALFDGHRSVFRMAHAPDSWFEKTFGHKPVDNEAERFCLFQHRKADEGMKQRSVYLDRNPMGGILLPIDPDLLAAAKWDLDDPDEVDARRDLVVRLVEVIKEGESGTSTRLKDDSEFRREWMGEYSSRTRLVSWIDWAVAQQFLSKSSRGHIGVGKEEVWF